MVTVTKADVADAMHLDYSASDTEPADVLPTGHSNDIAAAEAMVGTQVEPHAEPGQQAMVDQCAVYVAAAFIGGTEGDHVVRNLERESQSIRFDTEAASDEAMDFWSRAQAFDPTNRLGANTTGIDFETI